MALDNAPSAAGSTHSTQPSNEPTGETTHKFVSFYLGERHYAMPAKSVAEVTAPLTATPLPDGPTPLSGIAPHRGDILAVIDTGIVTGSGDPAKRKAVVLRPIGDKVELPVAFNVDRIGEMLQIQTKELRHATTQDPLGELEASVNGQSVLVVDPSRIVELLSL